MKNCVGTQSPFIKNTPAYTCNGAPVAAAQFYTIACNPMRSAAVEACAGAGKTWMLVSRILRALLMGTKPEAILAITFTKKAAGEMRARLQEWLYTFAYELNDTQLTAELVNRGVSSEEVPALLPKVRGLHAQLLGQSRSVEIRTFHSWFTQLLRAAPMGVLDDLGLPAQYELVEDDAELFEPAWYALLQACLQNADLKEDLEALIREQGRFNTQAALRGAWSRRIEFGLADAQGVVATSVADAPNPCDEVMSESFVHRWLGYAKVLGNQVAKTPQSAATAIEKALSVKGGTNRFAALRNALFLKTKDQLSVNLQKFEVAQKAEIELSALLHQHRQHHAYIYQQRMLRLTRVLLDCYAQVKREQGIIDMADLERIALRLLGDTETYGWVAERLDARISQVLIDEFQDTNPLQWQALRGWLSAYAGAGGGGRLSVFIVGDPKQSIYRFRRADPAVFNAACHFLQNTLGGDKLACDHTRRNSPEVMAVVNTVFEHAQRIGEFQGFRAHTTAADSQGLVAKLPLVMRDEKRQKQDLPTEVAPWRDSLTQARYVEEEKLRMRETRQVADLIEIWIRKEGWRPSDIKVLARKKDRLRELLLELNHRSIPWRFSDDVELIETQEVQDMVALLDVLVSPMHDLSLAQVLRSPIFGLDDEALMCLAEQVNVAKKQLSHGKMVCWWAVLQTATDQTALSFQWPLALQEAAQQLKQWKTWAQTLPPHDLLDAIYNQSDALARYAQAVPAAMRDEVMANLRALLQHALSLDGGRYASAYNFVRALRSKGIKSEHPEGGDAVELLTVHGAKGLEARGIIMLDTDPPQSKAERLSVLMDWPAQESAPRRFVFFISTKNLSADVIDLAETERKADQREELNALYVAMTRAKERLVFSALQTNRGVNTQSWWHRLDQGDNVVQLGGLNEVDEVASGLNTSVARTQTAVPIPVQLITQLVLPTYQGTYQADELVETSPQEQDKAVSQQPDLFDLLRTPKNLPGMAPIEKDTQAQRFGSAVHRLLEWGSAQPAHVQAVAQEMSLDAQQARDAAQTAQRILTHPQSSKFFDPEQVDLAHNEVEILHQGEVLRIDRLVQIDGHWWILDFKSALNPQKRRGKEYQKQLALYKEALSAIYPDMPIHTLLIGGSGETVEL